MVDIEAAGESKLIDPLDDLRSEDCEDEDNGCTIAVLAVFEMRDNDGEAASSDGGGGVVNPETLPSDTAQEATAAVVSDNRTLLLVLMVPNNMVGVLIGR